MYIHEHKHWPRLTWDNVPLMPVLYRVRHKQGRLKGYLEALGFRLSKETGFRTLTLEALKTSEIEGELLNPEQVRSSLARKLGLEIAGLVPSERHVDGLVDMMLDATRNYTKPLSKSRLFSWHSALFPSGRSGIQRIRTGAWRDGKKGPMQVVSGLIGRETVHFEAPEAKNVEKEMKRFLLWFNSRDSTDAVIRSALAHFWFVTIHPF